MLEHSPLDSQLNNHNQQPIRSPSTMIGVDDPFGSSDPGSPTVGGGGPGGPCYHLKILVPAVAAGAIIGKGGETIAHLQKEAGARVKMSKANDFYPGTNERVCLISGTIDGVLKISEFIMEKIKEKPDPNAKMAIDFDHKQPAEREKQVKVLVPNSTAGMIIGKGGNFIKQMKEESGAYIQISQKSRDHALAERCITIIGDPECNRKACAMILSKVVEDPQSGTCLNVSYADVTGPVANFNPTGSPYAHTGTGTGSGTGSDGGRGIGPGSGHGHHSLHGPSSHHHGHHHHNSSHPSYSSNGSLNSLSPTLTNSGFGHHSNHHQGTPGHGHGHGGSAALHSSAFGNLSSSIPSNSQQMIESIKSMLRVSGYAEEAVSEISSAMSTLANYGMLGLGLGLSGMVNPIGGMIGPNAPLGIHGNGSASGFIDSTPMSTFPPSPGLTPGSGGHSFTRTGGNGHGHHHPMDTYSEFPSRGRGGNDSPGLGVRANSPNSGMNDNSFGLGSFGDPAGRKSPTSVRSGNDGVGGSSTGVGGSESQTKVDVEIADNIVGAILGHGGKSLVEIQRISGANIQISKKGIFVPGTRNRIVTMSGSASAVSTAQFLIEQQIQEEEQKRQRQQAAGISSAVNTGIIR